jgi:hypothetical protein
LVGEAGTIEVRVVQAGLEFNDIDVITFELPTMSNDRGAVSLFCGDLNNTVGVRYEPILPKRGRTDRNAVSMTETKLYEIRKRFVSSVVLD